MEQTAEKEYAWLLETDPLGVGVLRPGVQSKLYEFSFPLRFQGRVDLSVYDCLFNEVTFYAVVLSGVPTHYARLTADFPTIAAGDPFRPVLHSLFLAHEVTGKPGNLSCRLLAPTAHVYQWRADNQQDLFLADMLGVDRVIPC